MKQKKRGKHCLVVERRSHVGGNIYTETIDNIHVHKYGPHIFHTNDQAIWNYVNQFASFNRFTYMPKANFKGQLYSLPFNMNTFYEMWGITKPQEARAIINEQIERQKINVPRNLEEQAIVMVGVDIYEKLIKGYTEKQWGRQCNLLPSSFIKRLPLRFVFDNNYFNDAFQGIPIGGYTPIIKRLLEGVETKVNFDFFQYRDWCMASAEKIIFTGMIDQYFDYRFGELEYRSLRFETEHLDIENFQGAAVINYTERDVPYTRIIEHKHFEFGHQPTTIITKEYPLRWQKGEEAFYALNDGANNLKFKKYQELANNQKKVIFAGRLAEYRYYDMHQIIGAALKLVKDEFLISKEV